MSRVIPFPAVAAAPDESRFASSPIPLHNAVAASRRRHRSLIAAAGQWAMARGVSLSADHVAIWAAAAEDAGYPGNVDDVTGPWRVSDIPDIVATVAAWCALAGCPPPADLAQSLWHLYGFLAADGRLDRRSDALSELRAAVVVFGGFDRFRPVSPPSPSPTAA